MRANVLQRNPDKVVQEVLDRLTRQSPVDGPLGSAGVQGVVEAMFHATPRPESFCLDLIAHSRKGVLHIGDWAVTGNDLTRSLQSTLAEPLQRMPLREIRLLGCNTAVKADGRAAMRALSALFGARVWGTKAPISANDFDCFEFCSTGLLADHHDIARFIAPMVRTSTRWFAGLGRTRAQPLAELAPDLRTESEAEALDDWHRAPPASRWEVRRYSRSEGEGLFSDIEPGMARVPGILALPELEVLIPVGPDPLDPRYHRLTLLLDHEIVRVYPRAIPQGCVFRLRKSAAAGAWLQRGELIRE